MSTQSPAVFQKPGDLQRFLESGKSAIAAALPHHLKPDRMLRLAVTCFSTTPALRKCTGVSILSSLVVASQLGLEPGVAGQGYLIPYGSNCTFVPGWQGLVGLLNNTGRATAWTGCVFEGDEFDFQLGSAPRLIHKPGPNYGDAERIEWFYACGKVNGSEQPVIEAWPAARVWKHRDKNNKVGKAHYSYNHPEMYGRKVVLLQVLKYMPRSIELNNAIVAADSAEVGMPVKVVEGIIEPDPQDIDASTGIRTGDGPNMTRPKTDRAASTGKPGASGGGLFGGAEGGDKGDGRRPEDSTTAAQGLRNLCKASRITEEQLLAFINRGVSDESNKVKDLDSVYEPTLRELADNWLDLLPQINPDASPLG